MENILQNKLQLAISPTPLYRLDTISEKENSEIWIKRDDMTGSQLSGNKVRKLEYLLKDAIDNNYDTIITCGGEQSNHSRATAIASRRLGLDCHLVLRKTGEGPSGNWLLDMISGATFKWIASKEYKNRNIIMEKEANKLSEKGKKPYIIPEGGSNPIGVLGYIAAAKEIARQAKNNSKYPENITVAVGTTGTYVGLLLGFALEGLCTKIIGISSGEKSEVFVQKAKELSKATIDKYNLPIDPEKLEILIVDRFIGGGYGIINSDIARFIMNFAYETGIILDQTYTAKAAMGALEIMPKPKRENGINIIIHTGGLFGLFTKGQFFRELFFLRKD
ncbi:MAG: 1-aminocyclopropane-1-carboxylate deaminase/D-cysteine desulfhydrase [Candidatus Zixiibacteriota bacterium]